MPGLISRALGLRPQPVAEITTSAQLAERLKAETTDAGVDVNAANAVEVATVFACVRLIAEDVAKLPFLVYRRDADGSKERATDSPFYRLIHDRPNPYQSSQQFRELLTAHALLRGNGFAHKNPTRGQVRELIPIHPGKVRIEQLDDYELRYHVTEVDGVHEYGRREIFHLPGISLDGFIGAPVVTLARQTIGHTKVLDRHGALLFKQKTNPGGAFKHPGTLSDRAYNRLKDEVNEIRGEGSHRDLLLEEGMDWTQIGLSNEDSQFLESRKFQVSEIARWFRVPPHKVGDLEKATFSNIEHQSLEYVSDTLLSWAKRWENAFNQTVIGTNGVFAEMLFDSLLRGDTKTRYEAYNLGIISGILSPNEARRLENLNPREGGDEYLRPLNMASTDDEEVPA